MDEHMGELLFSELGAKDKDTGKVNLRTYEPHLVGHTQASSDNTDLIQESIKVVATPETWMSDRLKSIRGEKYLARAGGSSQAPINELPLQDGNATQKQTSLDTDVDSGEDLQSPKESQARVESVASSEAEKIISMGTFTGSQKTHDGYAWIYVTHKR